MERKKTPYIVYRKAREREVWLGDEKARGREGKGKNHRARERERVCVCIFSKLEGVESAGLVDDAVTSYEQDGQLLLSVLLIDSSDGA